MAIPKNDETYLDRLLTSEQATGLPHILNLDPNVNVSTVDQRYLQDAYNYYLGGGRDAAQADFPIQASGITTQVPATTDQGTGEGGTGITATGVATPIAPTVEQTAAMEDIGAIPSIIQDPMTGDASIAEAIAAQDRQDALNQTIVQAPMTGDASIAEAIAAQDRQDANVTAEAQGAWQKVQSGLASAEDFIRDYGMATYNFLRGNIGAGLAGIAGGPVGVGLTAGLGALGLETTPEQKAQMAAAQTTGIADPNDPRKDIYGTNIVSAFGDYDQSVADSIATLEESGANPEKLVALKNYQNEKEKTDASTITARDEAIDAGIAAADDDSGADMLDIATGIDDFEVSGDIAPGGMDQVLGPVVTTPTTTTFTPRGGGADRDPAPDFSGYDAGGYDPAPAPVGRQDPEGGGSGGDSGGKIVCTMMNDSYGFGSFRNKIWLRQSKNLAPEYQIGYHKIFLPLVKLSKKNIVLKKVLEHIAVHRTIDIRQEARGKTHILGRIYRKILEPICYWVGKYGKRT